MTIELDPWVREANESDTDQVNHHIECARREASSFRGTVPQTDCDPGEAVVLVGGLGSTVMGSLSAVEIETGRWRVCHVHVLERAREVGIGDLLLRSYLSLIGARGAQWCEATALPGDRATKNLFERHGLVAQSIVVGRSISDPSSGEDASR